MLIKKKIYLFFTIFSSLLVTFIIFNFFLNTFFINYSLKEDIRNPELVDNFCVEYTFEFCDIQISEFIDLNSFIDSNYILDNVLAMIDPVNLQLQIDDTVFDYQIFDNSVKYFLHVMKSNNFNENTMKISINGFYKKENIEKFQKYYLQIMNFSSYFNYSNYLRTNINSIISLSSLNKENAINHFNKFISIKDKLSNNFKQKVEFIDEILLSTEVNRSLKIYEYNMKFNNDEVGDFVIDKFFLNTNFINFDVSNLYLLNLKNLLNSKKLLEEINLSLNKLIIFHSDTYKLNNTNFNNLTLLYNELDYKNYPYKNNLITSMYTKKTIEYNYFNMLLLLIISLFISIFVILNLNMLRK